MTPDAPPRIFVVANFVMACCWRVSCLPKPDETRMASALSMEPGGKGLNVAIGTHRLGAHVDLLLGIGRDAAGQQLLDLLGREGLGTAHVHALAAQSGYGAGMIADDGHNAIAVFPGPNLLLGASHADQAEAAIAAAALVYGQFETSVPAVQRAFELARRHGVRTVLNPSPWQPIAAHLLASTDVIVVNEVEAASLLGLDAALAGQSVREVATLLAPVASSFCEAWRLAGAGGVDCADEKRIGPSFKPLLVITLGAAGCVAFQTGRDVLALEAFAVEALDSMGAGDAFASALCVALCQQRLDEPGLHEPPLKSALLRANAAGAWMASKHGVLDALPSAGQLDAFYASRRIL